MKKLFYVAAVALIALTACGGKEAPQAQETAARFTPKLDTKTDCSITMPPPCQS